MRTERYEQVRVMQWSAIVRLRGFDAGRAWLDTGKIERADLAELAVPELTWLHAVPNGGARGDDARGRKIRGAQLKAEGVKQGVADLFLPVSRVGWHGLYVELKRVSKSRRSDEQIAFAEYCGQAGYAHRFCVGHMEAIDIIESYLRS